MDTIKTKKQYLVSVGRDMLGRPFGGGATFSENWQIVGPADERAEDADPTTMSYEEWVRLGRPTEINVTIEVASDKGEK